MSIYGTLSIFAAIGLSIFVAARRLFYAFRSRAIVRRRIADTLAAIRERSQR